MGLALVTHPALSRSAESETHPALTQGAESADASTSFRYEAKGLRDPFLPLVRDGKPIAPSGGSARVTGAAPVLAGILWDPQGTSMALINETEVRVGDVIEGYDVVEIQEDAVVLQGGSGEPLVLRISFESVPPAQTSRSSNGR
jgi:hypothetical protein